MSARSEFGVVVRIEHDSITAPAGSLHRSHNPANANRESSCIPKWNGCFSLPLREPSREPALPSVPPLRTVLESFQLTRLKPSQTPKVMNACGAELTTLRRVR